MKARWKSALDRLGGMEAEAGLVLKPENLYYLTGFFPTAPAALLLEEEPLLLVSRMDTYLVQEIDVPHRVVASFEKEFQALLHKKLAVEKGYLTYRFYEKHLRGKTLSDLAFLEEMRARKDPQEVREIRRAVAAAEGAMRVVWDRLAEGRAGSERDLAADAFRAIGEGGNLAFETIIASGENSRNPHHRTGRRRIRRGDPVLVDLGARVAHYHSDMTRTYVPGEREIQELYGIVLEAQKAGIRECRAGNPIKRAEEAVRAVLREHGLEEYFLHSTGHGVGLEVHESPRVSSESEGSFERGMVVTVEPGVYREIGIRIEDMVYVGARPKVLTTFRK
jgi:Xaa-Pro aminopeptidase